ncbi:MAG: FAD-dependent oxidoreductase [Longimicrobiales bacterium]
MGSVRIAVIGGGAAGLSAAWLLREQGASVTLYEKSEHAGGLLSTAKLGDARVDTAVQLVSSTYTRLFALAEAAGAGDALLRSSGLDALWRKGSAQEITYGNASSMALTGALPTMLKLKLATKYVPFLTLQLGSLDVNDLASTGGAAYDSESIARWGEREIGDDFVEYLAYPLLAAYYGSPPEVTSAALYHGLARVGMDVELYAARGGMGGLASRLADGLARAGVEMRLGSTVTRVSPAESGAWDVHTTTNRESYDGVVVATPPGAAHVLLQSVEPLASWLSLAETRPAATVGVLLEGTLRAPYFGMSFPRHQAPGDRIVAITLQQNKPGNLVPKGMSALTIFPAPTVVDRVAAMSNEEALSFLAPSLEQVIPSLLKRVKASAVYSGDARYRSLAPGLVRRIQELREMQLPRGLSLAGDYTMAPTVEGAVCSGEAAARVLIKSVVSGTA